MAILSHLLVRVGGFLIINLIQCSMNREEIKCALVKARELCIHDKNPNVAKRVTRCLQEVGYNNRDLVECWYLSPILDLETLDALIVTYSRNVLDILIRAKEIYMCCSYRGMCSCISTSITQEFDAQSYWYQSSDIQKFIPEFNVEFLEATTPDFPFWWHISDKQSRLNAFDKLIECYRNKVS